MESTKSREVKETIDILLDMATMLNTGLDRDTLSLCISLCEKGVNPEALAVSMIRLFQNRLTKKKTKQHCLDRHQGVTSVAKYKQSITRKKENCINFTFAY
ncbi:mitotic-spindle organizing gamma-tubulin ring associated-domain-containing protein [Mycotypha africana]|uniref:mitotic-spindle organizing gamma-tubulin ring associated-domain-containing protein n=1 Tax=Mycotypha africana TaxID=64632 RepID=UPI002301429D|nr:mitotic-spindle organizing gamma-tubulin ring associated-domain-containing protein [Mycotypha africana]KAI8987799.1 mitotic-spindle organizing gamma-tubulin ring associated-domain-containing protein [Mycotypha africana]